MRSAAAQYLLIAVTLLAMGRVSRHEFINWDDEYTISTNPQVVKPTLSSITEMWKHSSMGLWVPATYTLWAALSKLSGAGGDNGGPNPWIFHSASLVIHVISALIVFRIIKRLLPARSSWPALAGALVFAIHPLQVEAVAWASGMKDLLAGAFVLLAIYRHLQTMYRRTGWLGRVDWLAIVCFALALLAKPSAVVAIPIVVIIDRMFLNQTWRQIAVTALPWCIVALPIAIVARLVQSTAGVPAISIPLRPLVAGDALAFYLWKLVWPINLVPDYGRMASRVIEHGWIWWTWIVPAFLGAIVFAFRHRARPIAAGAMIFVAGLLPVLSLMPFLFQFYSTVADHYVYVSMLGVAIAVAFCVARGIELSHRPIVNVAAIALLATFGVLTFRQTGRWRDSEEIFRHTIRVNPLSVASENNLGAFYTASGDYSHAIAHYDRALQISPTYRLAHSNLAQLYALTGRTDLAMDHFETALALWDHAPAGLSPHNSIDEHLKFAQLLEIYERHDAALRHAKIVLAHQPENVEAKALVNKIRATTQSSK